MSSRTKIVATIGPATGELGMLRKLARAGVDVFRVNFSHGTAEQRQGFLDAIRTVEREQGEPLAVMADLCGPKIRAGIIRGGSVLLAEGAEIVIQRAPVEGDAARIATTLPELCDEVNVGEKILLDDGKLRLVVVRTSPPDEFVSRVERGGMLSSGKGINLPHTQLKLSALTEKDRADVDWIAQRDFDYVALSFVRSPQDVQTLRELLMTRGCGAHIIAKIEKPQALQQIDKIVDAADGVMVARGDMGVEMDLPAVPVAQKRIARFCQVAGKPCIVATQMLESMIASPSPTRAEVSDVANAALDHTDAVMLSGETAVGKFPVEAVTVMNEVVAAIESYHDSNCQLGEVNICAPRTPAAMAAAVRQIIAAEEIAAVAVFTSTGATALLLAKNRLPRPILAISDQMPAVRRMCLYYGVQSVYAPAPEHTRDVLDIAAEHVVKRGLAKKGQKIVVLAGRPIGQPGSTNTLVVHTV